MLQLPTQECDKFSLLKCKEFNFGSVVCLVFGFPTKALTKVLPFHHQTFVTSSEICFQEY